MLREQRQWQVNKQEMESICAQQIMVVILTRVVRECITDVVEEIQADLKLPQAFAMRLLTQCVAAAAHRCDRCMAQAPAMTW